LAACSPAAAPRPPSPQPQPASSPGPAPQPDAPLRVSRPPLKRRSMGQLPGRGLSRNYAGKSQSFTCIQDLTRNPWGADTAVALAKRSRQSSPLDIDCCFDGLGAAAVAASPFALAAPLGLALPPPSLPRLSPCEALLSWSIGEEEECLLGGVTCSARLRDAASCSSSEAGSTAGPESAATSRSSSGALGAPPAAPLAWPAPPPLCSGPCASGSSDDDAGSDDVCMATDAADALTAALTAARLAAPPQLPQWLTAAAFLESV
jgi:hypothetical protein